MPPARKGGTEQNGFNENYLGGELEADSITPAGRGRKSGIALLRESHL